MFPELVLNFLEGEIFGSLTIMLLFAVVLFMITFNKMGLSLGVSSVFILAILYAGMEQGKIQAWVFYSALLVIGAIWFFILSEFKRG